MTWAYSPENHEVFDAETQESICELLAVSAENERGRLIAAAPELLEALANTLSLARLKWGNLDPDANFVFDKALAALAKARGEQP